MAGAFLWGNSVSHGFGRSLAWSQSESQVHWVLGLWALLTLDGGSSLFLARHLLAWSIYRSASDWGFVTIPYLKGKFSDVISRVHTRETHSPTHT